MSLFHVFALAMIALADIAFIVSYGRGDVVIADTRPDRKCK